MRARIQHSTLVLWLGAAACGEAPAPPVTLLATARLPQSATPLGRLEARVNLGGTIEMVVVEHGRFEVEIDTEQRGALALTVEIFGRMSDGSDLLLMTANRSVGVSDDGPDGGDVILQPTEFALPSTMGTGLSDWAQFFYGCGFESCQYLQVDAGRDHTCGIRANRELYCWGSNLNGQLGIGSAVDLTFFGTPQFVDTLATPVPEWRQVSAGGTSTCGVDRSGLLRCWGANDRGQIGNGSTSPVRVPSGVLHPDAFTMWDLVSVGHAHACAIDVLGDLWCWGANEHQQVQGTEVYQVEAPSQVSHPLGDEWAAVSAGERHTCALDVEGILWCWGSSIAGEINPGMGSVILDAPTQTHHGAAVWSMVSAGARHTCGILAATPDLSCWGTGTSGQLGDGSRDATPRDYAVGGGYRVVSAGTEHTCAVTHGGETQCWGDTRFGRTGKAAQVGVLNPTAVAVTGTAFTDVTVGAAHTCHRRPAGLECFGSNAEGQLGIGTVDIAPAPNGLPVTGVTSVEAGGEHTCGHTDAGFQCWGSDRAGQITGYPGLDSADAQGTAYGGGGGSPVYFVAGRAHTCATDPGRAEVNCWGDNSRYQLGNGDDLPSPNMVVSTAPGAYTWVGLAAGADHTCGVVRDGTTTDHTVMCWGDNTWDQLGEQLSAAGPGAAPLFVPGLPGLDAQPQLAAGADHTCLVVQGSGPDAGQLWCWGHDVGTTDARYAPTRVGGFADWTAVACGDGFTCGIRYTGGENQLYCWGRNDQGQVGINGAGVIQSSPEQIAAPVDRVTAGRAHACFGRGAEVHCWGANQYGEVGIGSAEALVLAAERVDGDWGQVTAGADHTCALHATGGSIFCWGRNGAGQLGYGTWAHSTPMGVP